MKENELLEPEKLLAYCNGKLDDPEAVAHIRSSPACKKWISEHRLLRVLVGSGEGQKGQTDVSPEKLAKFVAEELPPEEMRAIENALIGKDDLLEDYLVQRTEHVAVNGPKPSKELDERVRNLLLGSISTPSQSTLVAADSSPSDSFSEIFKSFFEFLAPNRMALAGGMVAVLLIAVIGGKQVGLYGSLDFQPLIVASLEAPDTTLTFRGSTPKRDIATVTDGVLMSISLQLSPKISEALRDFGDDATERTFQALVATINDSINDLPTDVLKTIEKDVRFDPENLEVVQIHPSLWKQMQSDPAKKHLLFISVVDKKSDGQTLKTLYFSADN
jgi:hypothetical protein